MQRNSILFLTNAYPDFDSSYRGIFIKKMACFLKEDGYKISVVTPKIYRDSHYFEDQGGIGVYRFPFFAGNRLLIEHEGIPYLKMILYYISGFFITFYVMLKHQCSLIHVHWAIPTGLIGVLAGRLLRRPVVVTIHGSDFRMATEGPDLPKEIFLWVCQRAKQIICVSELQTKGIQKMGVRREKISTIPMGIDESFLEVGRNRKEKRSGQPHTILSNRNLLSFYNVSLLIRAIPMVVKEEPNTRFLIAGDGAEREDLQREVRELTANCSVEFLGRVPPGEMSSLLGKSDIYVSTSLFDGTSVSLLEAMGSGAFPVVTDIPANREWIVDGRNGFLVPIDQAGILAGKILEAIRDQELLKRSRKDNIALVQREAVWLSSIPKIEGIYCRART